MQYIGVTGFMSRGEVEHALANLPAGRRLMVGVLASPKSLRGERNKWWRRYPSAKEIADIFVDDSRCLNLIHFSSGGDDVPIDRGFVDRLTEIGGPCLNGFQFNGRWPDHHALRGVADQGRDVVLQLKTNRVKDVAQGGNPLRNHLYWVAAMFRDAKCHVLLDGSGGRGVAFDPAEMRNDVRTIRKTIGYFIGLGVAGGLCAETVRSVERPKGYDVSIDAEGMLRDGDDGGTMNLDKVAAYLEAAGRVLR